MAKPPVKVIGDKELIAKLQRMSIAARGPALVAAATAGILPIQNLAIRLAPYLTGTLRRSIHTETVSVSAFSCEVATGTDVDYAMRQEFGFNDTDALGRTYHQSANPYMRPAYAEQSDNAVKETAAALRDLVNASV